MPQVLPSRTSSSPTRPDDLESAPVAKIVASGSEIDGEGEVELGRRWCAWTELRPQESQPTSEAAVVETMDGITDTVEKVSPPRRWSEWKMASDAPTESAIDVRRKICKFWREGLWCDRDTCVNAHGEWELGTEAPVHPVRERRRRRQRRAHCPDFEGGNCKMGENCPFVHMCQDPRWLSTEDTGPGSSDEARMAKRQRGR